MHNRYHIVADESVDFGIVTSLRQSGKIVYAVAEQHPSITDTEVLSIAFLNEALLITEDKDFGELVFRLNLPHNGIVLIRLDGLKSEKQITSIAETIVKYFDEMISRFSVVNEKKLRIRA